MSTLIAIAQVLQYLLVWEPVLVSVSQHPRATEAVARQPEAEGKITKLLLLGSALAEATAIYGFVVALMIIIMLA